MDFFGQQEQARKHTSWLIVLFTAAVILIVLAVYLAVTAGLFFGQYYQGNQHYFFVETLWNPNRFLWVTGITIAVIAGGSWFRMYQLKEGGGAAVAEMLGGSRVPASMNDPLLRRLLNVVEEMAIASGLPVPPVYLLEQSGINAFAAGFAPSDAVITVTRGAIELLNRDELQGVIAHEFSHIFNGDTRLKMRLMGLLFGVTLISDTGGFLLTARHSVRYSSRGRGTHPALVVIGILLFVVGTIGAVFADMIKRAVSRQREFLADAAAVQFTRNPEGIAGALKVIGGYKEGSRVSHPAAQQASHFFFGNALKSWKEKDWWATHPPLEERIRRIEPCFQGRIENINAKSRRITVAEEAALGFTEAPSSAAVAVNAKMIMDSVGNPGWEHLKQARALIARIPERLCDFAHDPYTARATVYTLLLGAGSSQRSVQLQVLEKSADANVFRETLEILPVAKKLAPELRLPLLDMMLPALKSLSQAQSKAFRKNITAMIKADHKINLFEYMLHRMLMRHLRPSFANAEPKSAQYQGLHPLLNDCAWVLAMLSRFGSHADPERVYADSMAMLGGSGAPEMPDEKACRLSRFDRALNKLALASPEAKRLLLQACVQVVLSDGRVVVKEMELLRTIADAMDCPMPPIFVST
ncbi:MAG: M48 family metallopeptidase [Mariprofundaceae bacterium]